MTKKPTLTDEDKALFRNEMNGVKPIKGGDTIQTQTPKISPMTIRGPHIDALDLPFTLHTPNMVTGADFLEFARPGIHHNTLKRLRQGLIPKQATLDLHGKNVDQASIALFQFINACIERDYQHVLIIHGKGGRLDGDPSILKSHVNQWLRELPDVLAFYSTRARDGGGGSVYVLLRRA